MVFIKRGMKTITLYFKYIHEKIPESSQQIKSLKKNSSKVCKISEKFFNTFTALHDYDITDSTSTYCT